MLTPTEAAQVRRVNHLLLPFGERVCVCRHTRPDFYDLGRFYVIDITLRCIVCKDINLNDWENDLLTARQEQPS